MKGALLTGIVSLALGGIASAQLTDGEFKCQRATNKAGSKFVGAKAKCGIKCIGSARDAKPGYVISDCYAPYGGATLTCVTDPTLRKGAEEKFEDAIRKACDSTFKAGTECPSCYSGGNCTQEAADRVQNVEGQVDSFGPGVFCDQDGTNPPNADDLETKCELNTAKTLSKLVGSINKCYDKCNNNAFKGVHPQSECAPGSENQYTQDCINAGNAKSIAGVNKKCGVVGAIPDCSAPDDYPDGASWTNLVNLAIAGNVPGTFCPN